jgi:hypothetical protein
MDNEMVHENLKVFAVRQELNSWTKLPGIEDVWIRAGVPARNRCSVWILDVKADKIVCLVGYSSDTKSNID